MLKKSFFVLLVVSGILIGKYVYDTIFAMSILFIGDSHIELLPTPLFAINGGQSHMTSGDVLYTMRSRYTGYYAAVVIEVGSNDVAAHLSDDTFEENVKQLTWLAQVRSPRVIVCTIPPVAKVIDNERPNQDILRHNEWLRTYVRSMNYKLVDLDPLLKGSDNYILPEMVSTDHLHLNDAGRAAMINAINAALH